MITYISKVAQKLLFLIQTKKIAYLLTVFCGNAALLYALYLKEGLTVQWVSAFSILTGFVTSGYLVGKHLAGKEPK